MTPHFLFPCSPLNTRMIDEAFQDQAIALKQAGFGTSTFSIEENRVIGAVPDGVTIVYRGWMMSEQEYAFFYGWLLGKGLTPLATLEQYLQAHHLPMWYPLVEKLTPETIVFPDLTAAPETLKLVGWDRFVVKDYVKSLKTSVGNTVESYNKNPEQFDEIVEEMKKYRGTIEGGICVRSWEDLSQEQRFFVINGTFYGEEHLFDTRVMAILIHVAREIPSPFFSVDIAYRAIDGRYRIVEIGDGQVSDLVGWSPDRFAEIWK